VIAAGVPKLAPQACGVAPDSAAQTAQCVAALHASMLRSVDIMGVGSNVPQLDTAAEDRSATAGVISALRAHACCACCALCAPLHQRSGPIHAGTLRARLPLCMRALPLVHAGLPLTHA
jgi:hypothetical protein